MSQNSRSFPLPPPAAASLAHGGLRVLPVEGDDLAVFDGEREAATFRVDRLVAENQAPPGSSTVALDGGQGGRVAREAALDRRLQCPPPRLRLPSYRPTILVMSRDDITGVSWVGVSWA